MHEIVKWLAGLEEKACGLYNEAACLFYGDRPLERFFADLAVDEAMHARYMQLASEHLDDLDSRDNAFTLDAVTVQRVEQPFMDFQKQLDEGRIPRAQMVDCLVRMEYSEWNDLFLYVINSLQGRHRSFMKIAPRMEHHRKYIEEMLYVLPEGRERLAMWSGAAPLWRERILVAEDSPVISSLLVRLLRREGFCVEMAADGLEACRKMETGYFDLIVSDLNMPGMNGMDLFQQGLRLDADLANRFLIFSGYIGGAEHAFIRRYHLRYLEKPAGMNRLVETIRGMLRNQWAHRAVESQAGAVHC